MSMHEAIDDMKHNVNDGWEDFNKDVLLGIGIYYIIMVSIFAFSGIINAGDIVFSVIGYTLGFIVSALILFHKYVIYLIKNFNMVVKNDNR